MSTSFTSKLLGGNLVLRIAIGLVLGLALARLNPEWAKAVGVLGQFFVKSLRAIAPILIFCIVLSTIANKEVGSDSKIKPILVLYLVGTFVAALTAVVLSFIFPTKLKLVAAAENIAPPEGIGEVIKSVAFNLVDNPLQALANGNFIGILVWAIGLGLTLRHASPSTKTFLADFSEAVSGVVKFAIALAPIGIFGLVAETFAISGFEAFRGYARLLGVLLGAMAIVAFILNPLLVYLKIRKNPFPLTFICLRESGVTAFFTRSSAANIPVNMGLSKRLGLREDIYSLATPLGANINMAGAVITVSVFTLVCSLFNIPNDEAAQVIGVGFIIGVNQDSAETALNSSTDVLFTAAVSIAEDQKAA